MTPAAKEVVQLPLGDYAPPLRPELSQWHTPQPVADRMAAWCARPGMRLLEPCAGGGNLVRAAISQGVFVTAVEIDPAWSELLRADPAFSNVEVLTADFLRMESWRLGQFDLVLMNSPYEDGQDALWIERALEFAPRVVALVPSRVLYGVSKHERLWSKHGLARLANLVRRPVFAGGGGKFDLCVVDVRRDEANRQTTEVEWWS